MKKLISNQLSPHFTFLQSLGVLGKLPWLWARKPLDFSDVFGTTNYLLTNTARSALGLLAQAWDLPKEKAIGIPAFTCGVTATPFLAQGYRVVWIDTDERGVISLDDLNTKIDQCSAILAIHTFGQRAPMQEIYRLAQSKGVKVIEDGAHLFETDMTYCDAKILSFGREKDVSCVSGGALLWKGALSFPELPPSSGGWTIRHLLQPLVLSLAIPVWHFFKLGKAFAFLMNRLKVLPRAVTKTELLGGEDREASSLSVALQKVLRVQLDRRERDLRHRQRIAQLAQKTFSKDFWKGKVEIPENGFRVILKSQQAEKIHALAKAQGFELREWDGTPIAPQGVDLAAFGYEKGSCPRAESFARSYVTFPTHQRVREKDVQRFGTILKNLATLTPGEV